MNLEHLVRPGTAGVGLDVIGVESSAAQLVWSALPPGAHRLLLTADRRGRGAPERRVEVTADGGPGSIELHELAADTRYRVSLLLEGTSDVVAAGRFATLPPGRGLPLSKFATISDLHLGRGSSVYRGPLLRPGPTGAAVDTQAPSADPAAASGRRSPTARLIERSQRLGGNAADHPFECAAAAIDEALAWGAELLIVKGDVCEESYDEHWDAAAMLLGDLPVPVVLVPGNHDTGRLRRVEPHDAARRRGLRMVTGVDHIDLPGVRLVLVDSTVPGNGWGSIARHADEVAELNAQADNGLFIATHHQPQRFSSPLYWPHGIPGPDARRFARTVMAAGSSVLASSGHTHRCRVRRVAGMPWSEVSATNHYPAMWAGYRVHEGSIAQTARRIAAPGALDWSEHTRPMLGGAWALWAPGSLSDRSFQLDW